MLSDSSLISMSELVDISGTGKEFSTPLIYKFLLFILPAPFRSLTNIHYHGLEKIPKKDAVIFVANHTSHVDPFLKIIAANRPIHYLAKQEHFESQATKILMKSTGQIETARDNGAKSALSTAVDALDSGVAVGIFPEGKDQGKKKRHFYKKGKLV